MADLTVECWADYWGTGKADCSGTMMVVMMVTRKAARWGQRMVVKTEPKKVDHSEQQTVVKTELLKAARWGQRMAEKTEPQLEQH